MEPYRPLYAIDDKPEPAAAEDHALAVLLIVLGALRVVPAVVDGEAFGAEATVAAFMVALGALMLTRVPARWRRRVRRMVARRRAG